ncbi:MAG: hypothetical protein A3F16_00855 [Deltaproteobacteria bacterium RIFCSPHIGHO2_12_FULL_43_9]|nr:MAG: hypothetical protein A3F16_00855 [Deltaproteobacteria bacterium RIFCSPHIGHO2_12_FULL_43_9]
MEFITQYSAIKTAVVAEISPQSRAILGGAPWMAMRRGTRVKKATYQMDSGGEINVRSPPESRDKRRRVDVFTWFISHVIGFTG